MKIWKIILSSLVIFAAGIFTGGVVSKTFWPPVREFVALPSSMYQGRIMDRMKSELDLTKEQKERIAKIFNESHERMDILWKLINPEVQAELREVREKIRAELTPAQREKFEQLLKQRPPPHRKPGDEGKPGARTNSAPAKSPPRNPPAN